ncbi:redoxin domain-containing protein [Thiomicrorhabdus sp. Milos-T2]|uniref:redoxin domain-containing protein n=1 Tax=Thiomicrorhabdus sp. Milos-T2 TaxID=90814 RepID=UPI00056E3A15|nr:redoxin domain-containing protein [Thiomicrorhabdus sp. Milos-T2]
MSNQPNSEQKSQPLPTVKFWQKKWVKNLITVVIFVAIYLSVRPFMQGDVIHGQAPIMQVTTINGNTIDLQALNQQGKPVLIHIWATWCPICKVSKGGVESIAKDYAVINIATQSADNDQLLTYAKENEMNPNIIVNDLEGKWLKTFGAKAVPADFVVAPNGKIEFVEVGFTTAWGLRLRLWWAGL